MKQRQRLRMERKRKSQMMELVRKLIDKNLPGMMKKITDDLIDSYVDECFRAVLRAESRIEHMAKTGRRLPPVMEYLRPQTKSRA